MQATDGLREDHDVILGALNILERFCSSIESGSTVDVRHLQAMLLFLRFYVDDYHHQKEETVLFPRLIQRGISNEFGPIGCMLHEHEAGRELIQGMMRAVAEIESGDKSAATSFALLSRRFIASLSEHIMKENNVLFHMADRVLTPIEQAHVVDAYKNVVKNLPAEYQPQELLKKLEALQLFSVEKAISA